ILSILLTSRLIVDPPWIAERVKKIGKKLDIDYIGMGLLTVGLGLLQVVLDKGQAGDWFRSPLIVWAIALSAAALVAVVVRELVVENPIVELRLFKDRNFLLSNVLIFGLGFALFGSTVLVPEFLQTLMGYSATQSGKVLSPVGFVIMAL